MKYLSLLAFLTLMGCSTSLDNEFSTSTINEDEAELKQELSDEDFKLLSAVIGFKTLNGTIQSGTTYGELLEEGKQMKQEADDKKEAKELAKLEAEIQEQERIHRLEQILEVSLVGKEFERRLILTVGIFKFNFTNNSQKEIKAFKGEIAIDDIFDERLTAFNVVYEKGIPNNAEVDYEMEVGLNSQGNTKKRLIESDLTDLKVKWIPEKIIYQDGSSDE